MAVECAINCDHIQTVSKAKVGAAITTMSFARMAQVTRAIRFALDL
jgi:mRNA interferase MazF